MKSVKEYRQAGYKVRVLHHREFWTPFGSMKSPEPTPKGGKTAIEITSPEGLTSKGEAKCSDRDNFCRKTGVAIALGRAVKILESKEKLKRMQENNDYSKDSETKTVNKDIDSLMNQLKLAAELFKHAYNKPLFKETLNTTEFLKKVQEQGKDVYYNSEF